MKESIYGQMTKAEKEGVAYMKKNDFRKYLAYVKEQRHTTIEEYYLEKDYFIP